MLIIVKASWLKQSDIILSYLHVLLANKGQELVNWPNTTRRGGGVSLKSWKAGE